MTPATIARPSGGSATTWTIGAPAGGVRVEPGRRGRRVAYARTSSSGCARPGPSRRWPHRPVRRPRGRAPTTVERRVGDRDRELDRLDVPQPASATIATGSPANRPGSRARPGARARPRRPPPRAAPSVRGEPARSHTVAPTQPPSRVTRRISATPRTGSVMKCTTRHAAATSKVSSSNGNDSAPPWRTSTPGNRARHASTNGGAGRSPRRGRRRPPRPGAGQGARPAADVERALPGRSSSQSASCPASGCE